MKILLLGTPKSGKTRLGNKLAKEHNIKFLDKLPEKYIQKTGLALGRISDYRVDIMFSCHTMELENKHKEEGYIIACGPLYTYCHFVCKTKLLENEEKIESFFWPAALLSRIIEDSLWYDEIHYLKYKGDDEYFQFFDESIYQAIGDLKIRDRIKTVE
jgi:hypothetical protein